jgi:hypothetical protein
MFWRWSYKDIYKSPFYSQLQSFPVCHDLWNKSPIDGCIEQLKIAIDHSNILPNEPPLMKLVLSEASLPREHCHFFPPILSLLVSFQTVPCPLNTM